MRPLHVLMVVENNSLGKCTRLPKQIRALLSAGYRVTVICPRDPDNGNFPGIRVLDYPAAPEGSGAWSFVREYAQAWLMAAWRTGKVFVTDPFDAIQVSGTPDVYFTIGAPFRLLGRPLVLDQKDLSPELFESRFGRRGPVYRLLVWLERRNYRAANRVVTVNSSLEQAVYERGGLRPGTVTVVGNGPTIEQTRPRPARPELRNGRRYLCVWQGVMGPQDRVDLAVRAVHRLVRIEGRTDCQFAFVGDGDARPGAQRLAATLGVEDWVSFPGWIRQDRAFDYLATADLGLEPNLEETVSPVKGMEFMGFGLPFVAFDLKETRKLAGDAALYARPGDVSDLARLVEELLADPARRAEMGATARQRFLDEVSWDHQQIGYLRVYEELLSRRRHGNR
ncbi:glycosyltransferase family 4 protein [Longispora sp. K20-0274]|uniref:glycosyltransferase family 4 protein n=1 Tax=Longispora sp. K20-0274 TaxID=3088255 RepID=UPI00399BE40D